MKVFMVVGIENKRNKVKTHTHKPVSAIATKEGATVYNAPLQLDRRVKD